VTPVQEEAVRRLVGRVIQYRSVQVQQDTVDLLEHMSKEIATITGEKTVHVELLVCDAALKAAQGET
jgi:histone H3/H4